MPGYAWNNRPNDLHFLTRYLSKLSEREYNWQIVNIDTAPEAWMSAPAVYISSDKPLRLTDLQKAQLKRYLDLGGMLICNPQIGSGRFLQSVNDLAEELYPQYAMRKAPGDHWLFRGQFQVDRQSLEVTTLSNGVRDLIVLFNIDWGADWQRNRDHGEDPAWRIGANLWLRLTGRGVLDSRLRQAFPKSDRRAKGKPVRIARASYFGHWDVEPAAWDRMAAVFREHVGRNIEVSSVPLADVTAADFDLVHLAGVSAFTLTADEKWALKRFASDGGTVLVESVGGNNTFALGIEEQIRDLFDRPVVPLSGDDPLITGERIEHGYDLSRVAWRRYTVLNLSVPRHAAHCRDSRGRSPGRAVSRRRHHPRHDGRDALGNRRLPARLGAAHRHQHSALGGEVGGVYTSSTGSNATPPSVRRAKYPSISVSSVACRIV